MSLTKQTLIKALQDLPEDTEILIVGMDHSLFRPTCFVTTALQDKRSGEFIEDFGEESTPEAKWGKRRKVVVIK